MFIHLVVYLQKLTSRCVNVLSIEVLLHPTVFDLEKEKVMVRPGKPILRSDDVNHHALT